MVALFALLVFALTGKDWQYSAELLLPSLAFAIFYAIMTCSAVLAINYGSLAKTSLIISCSLLIPTLYGIIFLGEPISATLIIGIVLLVVALIMVNYEKDTAEKRISVKWIIFVILSFFSSGMCSVVQRAKTVYLGKEGDSLFMVIALGAVSVILAGVSLLSKRERSIATDVIRLGWLPALVCGVANGLTNFIVICLNNQSFPASVMFPVISGGNVIIVLLYSVIFKRERFGVRQIVGFAAGITSIVLLNL